jgi:ribosomal protein L30/L7E
LEDERVTSFIGRARIIAEIVYYLRLVRMYQRRSHWTDLSEI